MVSGRTFENDMFEYLKSLFPDGPDYKLREAAIFSSARYQVYLNDALYENNNHWNKEIP